MPGSVAGLIAHSPARDGGGFNPLLDHLRAVAVRASRFGGKLGDAPRAQLAGILHDLGKARAEVQAYLRAGGVGPRNPHAVYGARFLLGQILTQMGDSTSVPTGSPWLSLANVVQGHHSGLKAHSELLEHLIDPEGAPELTSEEEALAVELLRLLEQPASLEWRDTTPLRAEMRERLLLSCLVDADHLEAEQHFWPAATSVRQGAPSIEGCYLAFQASFGEFRRQAAVRSMGEAVRRVRAEVLNACEAAAELEPGFFRLSVPTGGGKTLSGLAFALRHAVRHRLDRVVFGIPYRSITEQTAAVYREHLPKGAVLEHHSTVEPATAATTAHRLSVVNWDAPVVVTTTVQLFESLFSNSPRRVRKLHNLARSVIVIDEAQTLPTHLLTPTLDALRTLVEEYGASVVFCSATQPAFEQTPEGAVSIEGAREIVPQYLEHYQALRRVTYAYRGATNWGAIADEVRELEQALVVVNTRRQAVDLAEQLDGAFSFSTLQCGAHREEVMLRVRRRLAAGESVRLVSTQAIEAGVDIDFPTVYRAMAPLDSIIQAAGRCNREGLRERGEVVVFTPTPAAYPANGGYRAAAGLAERLVKNVPEGELDAPETLFKYFREFYALRRAEGLDAREVQAYRERFDFPEVAQRYRFFDEDTVPVLVNYVPVTDCAGSLSLMLAGGRLNAWRDNPSREAFMELMPFMVSVRAGRAKELVAAGIALDEGEGFLNALGAEYDPRFGFLLGLEGAPNP